MLLAIFSFIGCNYFEVIEDDDTKIHEPEMTHPAGPNGCMAFDGGEDPANNPNPNEDGDVDCRGSGCYCLPDVIIYPSALVDFNNLLDAIENDETDDYFSDTNEPYFSFLPNDPLFTDNLSDLQSGDYIMIKANNDALLIVESTWNGAWDENDVIATFQYSFD